MIEVAISSMEEALSADGNPIPAGSTPSTRDPLSSPKDEDAAPAANRWRRPRRTSRRRSRE
jgi:hypothetical protein